MQSFQISGWAVAANFALFFTVTCPLRAVRIFSSRSASIHCVRISSSQSHPWRSAFLCRNDVGCCMFQPLLPLFLLRPTSSARVQTLCCYQIVSLCSATLCSLRRNRPAAGAGHVPPHTRPLLFARQHSQSHLRLALSDLLSDFGRIQFRLSAARRDEHLGLTLHSSFLVSKYCSLRVNPRKLPQQGFEKFRFSKRFGQPLMWTVLVYSCEDDTQCQSARLYGQVQQAENKN